MMVMTITIITIKLLHGVKIRLCLVLVLPQHMLPHDQDKNSILKKATVAIRKQRLLQYMEVSTPNWPILSTTMMLKIDKVA